MLFSERYIRGINIFIDYFKTQEIKRKNIFIYNRVLNLKITFFAQNMSNTNDNNNSSRRAQTKETVIEAASESRGQSPSETAEVVFKTSDQKYRRSSTKSTISIKALNNKNKIFPQKLPPISKKIKMKKINKVKQQGNTKLFSLNNHRAEPKSEDDTQVRGQGQQQMTDGFEVTWNNLSYILEKSSFAPNFLSKSVPSYRVILKAMSGSFQAFQLTAVMGPSGAGKSTLLSCVCGKRTKGMSGNVSVRSCHRIRVSIITQNDYLTDKFTLREALLFASKAKNGFKTDHDEIINNVVNSLGLESCLETRLGKCSGGQRRKISIALELVSSPNILILDEPTSGLDSTACYQIVENLRDLTQHKRNPMAIVATIHQPSARVFNLFHNVYVISHNGQAIYHGPPGNLAS